MIMPVVSDAVAEAIKRDTASVRRIIRSSPESVLALILTIRNIYEIKQYECA